MNGLINLFSLFHELERQKFLADHALANPCLASHAVIFLIRPGPVHHAGGEGVALIGGMLICGSTGKCLRAWSLL